MGQGQAPARGALHGVGLIAVAHAAPGQAQQRKAARLVPPRGLAQHHMAGKAGQPTPLQTRPGVARCGVDVAAQHAPARTQQMVDGHRGLRQLPLPEEGRFLIGVERGLGIEHHGRDGGHVVEQRPRVLCKQATVGGHQVADALPRQAGTPEGGGAGLPVQLHRVLAGVAACQQVLVVHGNGARGDGRQGVRAGRPHALLPGPMQGAARAQAQAGAQARQQPVVVRRAVVLRGQQVLPRRRVCIAVALPGGEPGPVRLGHPGPGTAAPFARHPGHVVALGVGARCGDARVGDGADGVPVHALPAHTQAVRAPEHRVAQEQALLVTGIAVVLRAPARIVQHQAGGLAPAVHLEPGLAVGRPAPRSAQVGAAGARLGAAGEGDAVAKVQPLRKAVAQGGVAVQREQRQALVGPHTQRQIHSGRRQAVLRGGGAFAGPHLHIVGPHQPGHRHAAGSEPTVAHVGRGVVAQRVALGTHARRCFAAFRQQQGRALVAGAKHGGVGEVALEQLGAAAEVALVPVGQKKVAAGPQRVVRSTGVGPCPVLHAEVAQRLAQVGRALAVRGQRVERLQVGQPGECLARGGHGRHGLAAVVAQHGLHLPGQRVPRVGQAGAVQRVQRCSALAQRVFGHRQPYLCAGVSRLDHQGLEQRGAGGLGIALPQRQQSGSRQGHVVVARLRQRGIQVGTRLGQAQGFDGRRGGFAPVGRVLRRQGHGLGQRTAGRAQVSALLQCAAQPCLGGSPLCIPLRVGHCLPVQGQGGVTLPLQPVPVGVGLQQWRKAGRRGPRGVQPGARLWQAVQRHEQVGAACSGAGVLRALPGQGQALLRGVGLAVQHLQVRQGQLDHGPTILLRR